jgi:hypothetical protein
MIISLVLIILGFVFTDWSALALVGFAIVFILSVLILNTGLQYETGARVETFFSYDSNSSMNSTSQIITYQYTDWNDSTYHIIGYLLSVIGLAGGIFVLWTSGIGAIGRVK